MRISKIGIIIFVALFSIFAIKETTYAKGTMRPETAADVAKEKVEKTVDIKAIDNIAGAPVSAQEAGLMKARLTEVLDREDLATNDIAVRTLAAFARAEDDATRNALQEFFEEKGIGEKGDPIFLSLRGAVGAAARGELDKTIDAAIEAIGVISKESNTYLFLEIEEGAAAPVRNEDAGLLQDLLRLGWLETSFVMTIMSPDADKHYTLDLNKNRIDIVAFDGDYVEQDPARFIRDVRALPAGKIAVILTNSPTQEGKLVGDSRILALLGDRVFITTLEGDSATQWLEISKGADFYDFSQIGVQEVINSKDLIRGLVTAK